MFNFRYGHELIELTKKHNKKISEITIEREIELYGLTREQVIDRMKANLEVMRSSATKGLNEEVKSVGGIIGGDAKRVMDYIKSGKKTLCGDTVNKAAAMALSSSEVNASMGKICASATAGSCGIVPAAVLTAAEVYGSTEEEIINALFTASGVGIIIATNATVSGAEGGCQAECGAAAAMAAAAMVEMAGGTPEQGLHAGAAAIKNILGLVCDPIAGLVEAPCAKRNSSGVVNAMISTDLAMAGVKSVIPFDEVVEAMYEVGKSLPMELRETALGGVAATKTGKELERKIFGDRN
ncbi:L-serine dehydratase, subunit alpha [Gottschalkia acidurici 9a]|uniref:L-serine dehydratase n=1 Tax=Gottschalkia acidurici (strain ATCC 7906 / DSM 604 / BCRC 14475 / CIP 104303 / KCTC 5404 / NCIMB 10678 / 9a) TaxID=1128398 RepID=K0B2B7_GOTA9|nr:L-serine ammonia-lyase, iron-sulfur-dependent, subunit alpha [Gottschalkia acidurici]AFS78776.1 L-serine dehydratase, subunit alpha [Gottschalkia acidurici 9a]